MKGLQTYRSVKNSDDVCVTVRRRGITELCLACISATKRH